MKRSYLLVIALLFAILLVGCEGSGDSNASGDKKSDSKNQASEEPVKGGTVKVAFGADPDTLDWMSTGASPTRDVSWHIFETLFALDQDFQAKPMIAEGFEKSDDEKVYIITLRKDVKFHDGSTVSADDVVASINRWRTVSSVGTIADEYIESVKALDELTVEIKLNEVYNAFISDMTAPKSALMIIPKEIAEAAGEKPLTPKQYIGTGPYKFESWERGNQIVLTRFDDYSAREEEDWGGLTGKKVAYFDEIKFLIVKDPQVMINGLKTGIYDYAETIPPDLYQVVESDPNIDPVTYINGYTVTTPDKSEPPFDDLKVRQALNHALNKEVIAESAYGNKDFYSMDGALFDPEQTELYSKDGTDDYLSFDQEKAKQLLKESGYDGKPIKIMYSNDTETYKRISQIMKQQMEAVGFKVELVPYDWATYLEKWQDPANWDLVVVGWSTRFSPNELGMLIEDTASSGWYKSKQWESQLYAWGLAASSEERKDILTDMNQTVNDELPFIKIANETKLDIKSAHIPAYDSWVGQRFWNTWKSE
ncbi:ABC transporter substrate-binding protein [Edaphobacillus lindanitolerans]|uniref:Peptide/nickel transport system substrate-binding protein n=1 Tax=Edaphobacillus lindanitolerans TaxID=550447 RepID=A0A1U7PNC9_9BACI|nr:ABC transporter substrate-binding protein [Edaphobacillus lindanitolerans]SIT72991.1 peptide/nickel transport system substrate-binding protein [Edaphobacillus lindanitolerans]